MMLCEIVQMSRVKVKCVVPEMSVCVGSICGPELLMGSEVGSGGRAGREFSILNAYLTKNCL